MENFEILERARKSEIIGEEQGRNLKDVLRGMVVQGDEHPQVHVLSTDLGLYVTG